MKFLDEAKIYVKSGDGGGGAVSFRREAYVEFGGPDGGDGGRGGDVVILCAANLNTLIDFRYQQHIKAKRGNHGMGQNRTGGHGAPAIITVPIGTQILDETKEFVMVDLIEEGQTFVLARGGDGGYGNTRFKTSTNRAPRQSSEGYPGEERWVWLRLKLIADAGLVGLPNAGKSTFLSIVTQAHPKIGAYPFTTINPNLGVVSVGYDEFIMADIPGLIEGASDGAGLGTRFLGHVERCKVLLHLVDGTSDQIAEDYQTIYNELEAYGADLIDKQTVLALNKCDSLLEEEIAEKKAVLEEVSGKQVMVMSGVAGTGVNEILGQLMKVVLDSRKPEEEESDGSYNPW